MKNEEDMTIVISSVKHFILRIKLVFTIDIFSLVNCSKIIVHPIETMRI